MGDHPHPTALTLQGLDRDIEGVSVKRFETLVDEQGVDEGLAAFQARESERQGQRDEEALAALEASDAP